MLLQVSDLALVAAFDRHSLCDLLLPCDGAVPEACQLDENVGRLSDVMLHDAV